MRFWLLAFGIMSVVIFIFTNCSDDGSQQVPCKTNADCRQGMWCDPRECQCVSCDFQCDGLECGPDGCGGVCGTCPQGEFCIDGVCQQGSSGIEWIEIPGGTFMMGSETGVGDELPVHQVAVPAFLTAKTETTVDQYKLCVDSGSCTKPYTVGECFGCDQCNWGVEGHGSHPVNCVGWQQSVNYCIWAGGRLPTEAEWEYAARSGGQDITYPWGNQVATSDYAVMDDPESGGSGCGQGGTWSVCSKPAGNTAHDLCDMSGNVWEWVEDWYHGHYDGAPSDGSAWDDPEGDKRVERGGSWINNSGSIRASSRFGRSPCHGDSKYGFRCAADSVK